MKWSGKSEMAFQFYDAIFESELAVYMLEADGDGRVTFSDANETVSAIASRPLTEIRGKTPTECLPAEIGNCLEANSRECFKSGRPVIYERSLNLPTGKVTFRTQLIPSLRGDGKISHIVGLTRDITRETDVAEDAQRKTLLLERLGIALPSAIYMLNIQARSMQFIGGAGSRQQQPLRRAVESDGDLAVSQFLHPEDHAKAKTHLAELTDLQDDDVKTTEYRFLTDAGEYLPYANRETVFSRTEDGQVEWVIGVSEDISERNKAQQEVRDLSKRMLTLQLEERRRIAQELHDSTGQHLAVIGMALGRALKCRPDKEDRERLVAAINDAQASLAEVLRETRVLTYLLHPPEITSKGLCKAISDFALGFGKRAGLSVDLETAKGANAASDEASMNLFRVCQEALTNVYRHADATRVGIALEADAECLRLRVADDGVGLDAGSTDLISGVGLASMRKRLSGLGGELTISSGSQGTTLIASIPINMSHP